MKISRKKEHEYEIIGDYSAPRSIANTYLGILLAVALFIPFVMFGYRAQIGSFLKTVLNGVGGFALAIGGLYILVGFMGVFTHNHRWVKHIVYGIVLLWIGCWCTGTVLNILGFEIGYHK